MQRYRASIENYDVYLGLTYADDHDAYFQENVAGPKRTSALLAGASALGLAGSSILWASTSLEPAQVGVGAASLTLRGTF